MSDWQKIDAPQLPVIKTDSRSSMQLRREFCFYLDQVKSKSHKVLMNSGKKFDNETQTALFDMFQALSKASEYIERDVPKINRLC